MSAFDINRKTLTSLYDVNGNDIGNAYDISGNSVFENENDPVLFTDIPSYFQDDVTNALAYVDKLGDGYVNYIVVTDTHYNSNYANSPVICNYMYGTGKFDKLIHLGDLLEAGEVESYNWNAMIETDFCHYKKWLFAQGNHDSGLYPLSDALPYFETSGVHYIKHNYHNGFYYDNAKYKIRFIGLHHFLFANSAVRSEVESFISSMPSDYKWCIINHYPMYVNTEWDTSWCMSEDTETWIKGLIDAYPKFIGIFSGHMHFDEYDVVSTGTKDFHHMTLDADILRSSNGGTNDEQVVTIISINPTAENVKFYRIGRSAVYKSKQWEYTGFTA